MEVKAKYPIKIGKILIEKGTKGETVPLSDVKKIFTSIKCNKESNQMAIKFSGLDNWCIVHKKQLDLKNENPTSKMA